ncbi:hypothetical protein [Kitasatospora sp. NPDC098663]|uniref:hypothetical protein n=1 Tax=Kitasatospora sp. NPDC098663 TaxID=3364096 RepID=UPI003809B942
MPVTKTLDFETFAKRMDAWASERDTKRGRLVRAFRKNLGDRHDYQAARLALLIKEAETAW